MSPHKQTIERYRELIRAAIAEDPTRSDWGHVEWRAYFLSEDTAQAGTITADDIVRSYGLVRGNQILDAIRSANAYAHSQLIGGGLDVTLPDAVEVLRNPLTTEERRKLADRVRHSAPRHQIHKLPDPRERTMIASLKLE